MRQSSADLEKLSLQMVVRRRKFQLCASPFSRFALTFAEYATEEPLTEAQQKANAGICGVFNQLSELVRLYVDRN
jgi:hypothetical protein